MKVKGEDGKVKEVTVFFKEVTSGGRPAKILTEDALKMVEAWSRFHATDEEIAGALGCCRDIFYNDVNKTLYQQAKEKGQSEGKLSLRRKQYEMAMNGNWHMLQWVGIQQLKQSNRVDLQAQVGTDENVKIAQELLENVKAGNLTKK